MSRAFRVAVSDSVTKVICAEDHVRSELELLDVLPREQMAELLAAELIKQGFERDGDELRRVHNDIEVNVNVSTGVVSVRVAAAEDVELTGEKQGYADLEFGQQDVQKTEQRLRKELQQELEKEVQAETDKLQQALTNKLEQELIDLRGELDRAVNRATAEALKQKASQMGQIKELTEDPESGSMTIVVEV